MSARDELVDRLWALCETHAPRRVLVVVRDEVTARWLASCLAERGACLGPRIHGLETLLASAMAELAGDPQRPVQTLAAVREALVDDAQRRYERIADQPSYQREVLRTFVELERSLAGGSSAALADRLERAGQERDAAMVRAFDRFASRAAELPGWWRGPAPRRVLEQRRRVSFLRRRAAAVALGFSTSTTARWELSLLDGLGFARWGEDFGEDLGDGDGAGDGDSGAGAGEPRALDLRLSCAGPEVEIAAVARALRSAPARRAVVLASSDAIPRWVARLAHRDVPVRAFVERRAASTAAARTAATLLRALAEASAVRRDAVEALLFGPTLRAWASVAEGLGLDYPRSPHPGDLREAWERQRASSFSLERLGPRLREAGEAAVAELDERGRRLRWDRDQLDARRARVRGAHLMLAAAVERLASLARGFDAASLHALLDDWDMLGRAAVHGVTGPEMTAARVIVELCAAAARDEDPSPSLAQLGASLDHALAGASAGSWEQHRALGGGGGPPVWVLPYASVAALGRLPARLFLTGLDAHPRPPIHHGAISDALRVELGLIPDRARFVSQLRALDELVGAAPGEVVASWRHRDGAGARRPPGPWIAGRQDRDRERAIGADAIALPTGGEGPCAPIEQALVDWSADPALRRRVEAIRSHDAREVGPHTGALGVRVAPRSPYSASSLQRYAQLPYQYFVERVIGLREPQRASDSASSLLAHEQGQVIHRALDRAHAQRLATSVGPVELATISEELLAEVLEALAEGYRKRAEHGQAEALWASERERWARELRIWWARWHERVCESYGPSTPDSAGRSGSRRKPEPEQLIPGLMLLASEWSPAGAGEPGRSEPEPFELELGVRKIPFVALVDRVELDPVRQRLDVVDFKTGRPRWPAQLAASLRAGTHLQLPLYALAVQQVAARSPERLRLRQPAFVGAMRLEYLQRPLTRSARGPRPEARGFAPGSPLGLDASGQLWTVVAAAAAFSLAFVDAIEAGYFPLVSREPQRGSFGDGRMHELARLVPGVDRRHTRLPPALAPLPDPRQNREVVR